MTEMINQLPGQYTQEELQEKRKKRKQKKICKFLIWTGVVIIVIFLTLFLSSRIGRFDSIASMLEYISSQF